MPTYTKVLVNRAQCKNCQDVLESTHRHDFKFCSCGSIAVDGGREYLRRVGNLASVIELSETMEAEYEVPEYLREKK